MGIITLIGIALSLAFDAFSVCVAAGVKIRNISYRHYFRLAFHFGLFQFLMPILGYYGGVAMKSIISRYNHWIALSLLSIIGIKMIWESFQQNGNVTMKNDPSRGITLVFLSIATSIDAAAVGFSLAALQIPILFPSIIIGVVCLLLSALGLFLGNKIGLFIGNWAERLGGIILISIGLKIMIQNI